MTERLDRIEAILERNAEQITSNARAIEANSNAIAQLRESQQESQKDFRASIEDVVSMFTAMTVQVEQDRVEFRVTVQNLLDAITRQFSGNGHGE